ncbi:MAG: DNA polymerase/3*-5* exonuclease PolX [Chloroflexi bacterium AL-W]|nr:DNA polymerase/3*-5* exonuclease PolX [Chloroflexi bacterium AL-W]
MALSNRDIADIFETISDMLQLKGENLHRYLSYRRAGETIRELPRDLRAIAAEDGLTDIDNIGKTLAEKIIEMLETDQLEFYEKLKAEVPIGVIAVMRLNGVGPKKAKLFWDELDITTIEALQTAAQAGKLAGLKGMGAKSEQKVLEAIEASTRQTGRMPLGKALPAAQKIAAMLNDIDTVLRVEIAGSIRRARPTIGDVDILVAVAEMAHSAEIMQAFVSMENVARILGQGETKSSVELLSGLQVDVRVLTQEKWGTALQYFTGSQAHNVKVRQIALSKGYSLNEHALSPVDAQGDILPDADKTLCDTEEAVYEALGLRWIAPELREDSGEIEAAQADKLPKLITLEDMRADLHMHTTYSDGIASVLEMAEAASARGREYIVITDHSRSLGIANGLSIERLMQLGEEIHAVNAQLDGKIRVFWGTEMDINADGSLDYPDDVLAQLDFVIASLHTSLRQGREQITERLLNAIRNPHVDLIGHPRAQLISEREPVDADMDAVLQAALEHKTVLEINANPSRLDLEAAYARRAVDMGILLAINTDAHMPEHMDLMHYGILTARRGWVQAESVINTWPLDKFTAWLKSR